jgi:FAD-dependent urate hydroxylase
MKRFDVIIIGAGPYGLSAAAHLRASGLNAAVFGEPMSFWYMHMPAGMLLRSPSYATDLSDPDRKFDLGAYFSRLPQGIDGPVPLEEFVRYGLWFQDNLVPDFDPRQVRNVTKNGTFFVTLEDGERIIAPRVVVASGIRSFARRPRQFDHLPSELASHTSDHRDLSGFSNRPVAVIGAGQSALESAALLHEAGSQVEVVVRSTRVKWLRDKGSPWLSVCERMLWGPAGIGPAGISKLVERPYCFRMLPRRLQNRYSGQHPAGAAWLRPRLHDVPISTGRQVMSAKRVGNQVVLHLDDYSQRIVDHVLLATGYRVDLEKYDFLSAPILANVHQANGFPKLTTGFESSVPGLYFLGAPAVWSFGPLLRFVAGTHFASRVLTADITRRADYREQQSLMVAEQQA